MAKSAKSEPAKTEAKGKDIKFKSGARMYQGREIEAFRWNGTFDDAPDWVDRNWSGYANGPALKVPFGPATGPAQTKTARIGDYVIRNPAAGPLAVDTFSVMPAAEFGLAYNNDDDPATPESTNSYRPPQESAADIGDLAKTGAIDPSQMDAEARAALRTALQQRGEPIPPELDEKP